MIDDSPELLSEFSQPGVANGFQALKTLDLDHDDRIDGTDAVMADLRIWRDSNSDGLSSVDELTSLNQAGILALNLDMELLQESQNGNQVPGTGRLEYRNGSQGNWNDVGFSYTPGTDSSLLRQAAVVAAEATTSSILENGASDLAKRENQAPAAINAGTNYQEMLLNATRSVASESYADYGNSAAHLDVSIPTVVNGEMVAANQYDIHDLNHHQVDI